MKILYIIESMRSGGKERRLLSLIKGLSNKENVTCELLLLTGSVHYKEIYNQNLIIHRLERNIRKDRKIISKFKQLLQASQPDIVHCWDNIAALHFAPVCRSKRIPFINSMITTAPPKVSRFSKLYLSYAASYPFSDVVLSNSYAGLKSYHVPKKKGRVIYNGFDFERVKVKKSAEDLKTQYAVGNKKVVGMVATFSDKKDYGTFVKAAQLVLNTTEDVVFMAIGDGPNLQQIKNQIPKEHENSFLFLGKQQDVESFVNIFDIGVLATFSEGISNAVMEYMIFEKPVIATGRGGTAELVIHNETGYLLESQKPELLAEKIIYLLNNADIAKKFGQNGAKRIRNLFALDKMINETMSLYKEFV